MKNTQKLQIIIWGLNMLVLIAITMTINSWRIKPIGVELRMVDFCSGMAINDTAECLTGLVQSTYKYVERVDGERITLNELMIEGGDCGSWSQFYKEAGDVLGKEAQTVTIKSGNGTKHRIAILSDQDGYCVFDGQYHACGMYGDDNDEDENDE